MMDKKYLKEHKLYEAHKQFMRLCEWSYVPTTLEEDGDDEQQDQEGSQVEPNVGNTEMPNNQDMSGNMPQDDVEQSEQNGDMTPEVDNSMGSDANQEMMPDMMNGDTPMEGDDETVIDVEDITNAQEKMNDKVNVVGQNLGQVDSKLEGLMQALTKMETMINNNNQEIANFKAEFEKRNPTQAEKLNLRSLDSYPFNVNPKDYWEKKLSDPNNPYDGFDLNKDEQPKEYKITKQDVDGFSDKDMERSFDIDDDLKQDINKIFGL